MAAKWWRHWVIFIPPYFYSTERCSALQYTEGFKLSSSPSVTLLQTAHSSTSNGFWDSFVLLILHLTPVSRVQSESNAAVLHDNWTPIKSPFGLDHPDQPRIGSGVGQMRCSTSQSSHLLPLKTQVFCVDKGRIEISWLCPPCKLQLASLCVVFLACLFGYPQAWLGLPFQPKLWAGKLFCYGMQIVQKNNFIFLCLIYM